MRHGRLLIAFLVACTTSTVLPTPAPAEALTIAVAGPQRGAEAARFHAIRNAVEHELASRGLDRTVVQLKIFDDGCNATTARVAAGAAIGQNVDIVIGHPCTRAALAAAEIYAKSETVFFATSTRHPGLTAAHATDARSQDEPANGVIFRLAGRDDMADQAAADYLRRVAPVGNIAIIHDRTEYGETLARRVVQALRAIGRRDVSTSTIIAGDKVYDRLVAKVGASAAVFFAGFPLEAGLVMKALRTAGSRAPFVVSETAATGELTATFGGDVAGLTAVVSPHAANALVDDGTGDGPARDGPARDGEAGRQVVRLIHDAMVDGVDVEDHRALARWLKRTPEAGASQSASRERTFFKANGDAVGSDFKIIIWDGKSWFGAP